MYFAGIGLDGIFWDIRSTPTLVTSVTSASIIGGVLETFFVGSAQTCFGPDTCDDVTEICSNTDGSFMCSCNAGYTLDWTGTRCDDLDECLFSTHSCTAPLVCRNTVGSFECECGEGYVADTTPGTCNEVDECAGETCAAIDFNGAFGFGMDAYLGINEHDFDVERNPQALELVSFSSISAIESRSFGHSTFLISE